MSTSDTGNTLKFIKTIAKILLWAAGIWLALLIILEIVLSGPVLTRIVNNCAKEYVNGELHFGKASVSMFRRFPGIVLTLDSCSVTYPSDRFDHIEKTGVQGHLMYAGCSESADTLASFRRFSVGLSLPSLLTGTIRIPYVRLDKPRIFAHSYSDGSANWDIFLTGNEEQETEEDDTSETSGSIPKIVIGKVLMTGRPNIVYSDCRDTVFAMIGLKKLELNGKVDSRKLSKSKIGLTLDSMFIAGRIARDTIAAGVDRLYLHEEGKEVNIDLQSNIFVATREFGRLKIPVTMAGILSLPKDSVPAISLRQIRLDLAHIPLRGEAELKLMSGKTYVLADMGIKKCSIENLLHNYAAHIIPETGKISTDAVVDMDLHVDGMYDHQSGKLPQLLAELTIPNADISYKDFPGRKMEVGLKVEAEVNSSGKLNAEVRQLDAGMPGIELTASGGATDLLGKDPTIRVDGAVLATLDSLMSFLPEELNISAHGNISALVKGSSKLSQLNIYNFSSSSLTGEIYGKDILLDMPNDTIKAALEDIKITLGPDKRTSRRDSSKTISLMGITAGIAKADIRYKDYLSLKASGFSISAKNVLDQEIIVGGTKKLHPFRGTIKAGMLSLRDAEGTSLRLVESSNSFNIFPKKGMPETPVLILTSRNQKIQLRYDSNRSTLNEANLKVSAAMNTFQKRQRMNALRDSLAQIYPYIPKDSLFRHHWKLTKGKDMRAERVTDDFSNQDIDISLDKTLAKYFREWDIEGSLTTGNSNVLTPYFPLQNTLKNFSLSFDNDRIEVEDMSITSGESDISVSGELTGLKRALLGRNNAIKLDLDIVSEKMNANELLTAYTAGSSFNSHESVIADELSDDEFLEKIAIDSTDISDTPSLIVIPKNINADISLLAKELNYSDLKIDLIAADLMIKDRCVRISDTQALTNMGDINLEGFYATRNKEDIKAGFSINFKDITAEKVINLMPSVDTLMPLLKSFGGTLNCELAATTQLDTNMNLIMPSINGILRISGNDLYIKNNDMFKKLARWLIFKNKKEGHIDKMTVEGVIKDSKVEVFPFILEMDRYMLGLSGIQNMDMSFRYHASLIKSPFLIKLGMDIYGPDFDNMKFKIGKAKYKSRNVPVFSSVIDNTKINLVESIRNIFDKGVETVMKENSIYNAIEQHKKMIGYIQAVDQKLEELSAEEQKQFEAEQQAQEQEEQQAQETTEQNAE